MELGFIALVVVTLAIGIAIGMFIAKKSTSKQDVHGVLNVNCSDPEDGPYLFLKLTVPIANVISEKRVTFDVSVQQ